MKYISTRGCAPELSFCEVLQAGLACDGGLYVPEIWPHISYEEIAQFSGHSYTEAAYRIIRPFVGGEINDDILRGMIEQAYVGFTHPAVAPLVQLAPNHFLLELFHGPTLAFKDIAMQLLARLMDYILQQNQRRITIVVATSGDTGGAAVEAFKGRDNIDLFILFPKGRVSPFQQRQMTTAGDANVHVLAIEGTFDDCQKSVKAMFHHAAFRDRVALSAVNSINWGRILAQIVYYFTAAAALGAPHRSLSFSVPTGNFGDIFAGYAAKRMGLPIERLVIATNVNDILTRTLQHGRYEIGNVVATASPSMDIQISSNFERLLYEATKRDGRIIQKLMKELDATGTFVLEEDMLHFIRTFFSAGRADETAMAAIIKKVMQESGYLLDPHTAIGVAVGEVHRQMTVPMVTLATAHPAKFAHAVEAACGVYPKLPDAVGHLMERDEHFTVLKNDQVSIESFIESRSRVIGKEKEVFT